MKIKKQKKLQMIEKSITKGPNYNAIFMDIVSKKHPDKLSKIENLLHDNLSELEVLKINKLIFGNTAVFEINQKYTSYKKETILSLLTYQRNHKLSNLEMSKKYNISRNTLAKWKKIYALSV